MQLITSHDKKDCDGKTNDSKTESAQWGRFSKNISNHLSWIMSPECELQQWQVGFADYKLGDSSDNKPYDKSKLHGVFLSLREQGVKSMTRIICNQVLECYVITLEQIFLVFL